MAVTKTHILSSSLSLYSSEVSESVPLGSGAACEATGKPESSGDGHCGDGVAAASAVIIFLSHPIITCTFANLLTRYQ